WKKRALGAVFTSDIAHKKNARILRYGHFLQPVSRLLGFHTVCIGGFFVHKNFPMDPLRIFNTYST
ncbi:hypothetical protein, partial [Pseudomonas silesiensis]|uniref:hypothetical protein n=1 Tax=Pseudomonas silesiensis TaxID=1853130 RepID=UPI0030DAC4D7